MPVNKPLGDAPALDIRGVHKTYAGDRAALRGIDLRIEKGAFFGLLGPNGAGKTSLIGLVSGLLKPQQGQIWVMGYDNQRQAMRARLQVGLVPQEVNFNSFEPIGEIVQSQAMYYGLPRRRARERTQAVLTQVGLQDRAGQKAWGLSGGMKRRLMLARALVHEPRLLIMDEPTAGLDIQARQQTWALLRQLNAEGVTMLLTTHYIEEAEALCGEVAIIDQGRIIARGSPQTLLTGQQPRTLQLQLASGGPRPPRLSQGQVIEARADCLTLEWPRAVPLQPLVAELSAQGIGVYGVEDVSASLESRLLALLAQQHREPAG